MNLVIVEWLDSHSSDNWMRLDEMRKDRPHPLHCRTVGWLVAKTKTMTLLVNSLAGEKDDVHVNACGEMSIPNACIQRVSVLRREK